MASKRLKKIFEQAQLALVVFVSWLRVLSPVALSLFASVSVSVFASVSVSVLVVVLGGARPSVLEFAGLVLVLMLGSRLGWVAGSRLGLVLARKVIPSSFMNLLFTSNGPRIERPPGIYLLRIAELLVSKKRYEGACVPTVADWHEEYFEALNQKRAWPKFFFMRVRYTWAFAKSLLLLGLFAALGKLLGSIFKGSKT